MPSQHSHQQSNYLQTLLASARPFLRGELESIDVNLPSLVAVLRSVGAGECWHKHGSFLDHLLDIYRILKIWNAPDSVCLCGLFHSAYSNSYVNLAIFDPNTGRDVVRSHVGEAAERLIHLFCIVPRQPLIHDDLLFKYSDNELVQHLKLSEISLKNAKDKDGKPGLWINSTSRMGALYTLIRREEEIFIHERKRAGGVGVDQVRDEDIELVVPPVFDECTKILDAREQIMARDLYWEAVCDMPKIGIDRAEELLLRCVEKNPFVGEPRVALGQVYLTKGRFEEAEKEAERGLTLMLEWGSPWDKRMSWEGWIAWARVLLMKAKEKSWPQTSWGILNLGLVR
ncbi:hypothetical protein GH714_034172 [Hevea brasiliensis]|uniref:DUF6817 domain-containing protein n=1 Tax=Hevea brasiliensis TaxID=3981 RepID=A0A6A6MIX3_HEVBR|nr:hypothetical protein GH714_034172 [Hevea brasiliensis]